MKIEKRRRRRWVVYGEPSTVKLWFPKGFIAHAKTFSNAQIDLIQASKQWKVFFLLAKPWVRCTISYKTGAYPFHWIHKTGPPSASALKYWQSPPSLNVLRTNSRTSSFSDPHRQFLSFSNNRSGQKVCLNTSKEELHKLDILFWHKILFFIQKIKSSS